MLPKRNTQYSGAEDHVRQACPRLHNEAQLQQHGQALRPDDDGREIPGVKSNLNVKAPWNTR